MPIYGLYGLGNSVFTLLNGFLYLKRLQKFERLIGLNKTKIYE